MKLIILIYFFIGGLVNVYYHAKNSEEYAEMLQTKQLSIISFIIGGILAVFIWPIAIYNNEFRGDKDE